MKLNLKESVVFALLGALMFLSKMIMEFLPNIHLVGVLIITYTICFRKKALYPIYIYVVLDGLIHGFTTWWIPYLYIWAILWAVTMLLPKNMKPKTAVPVYAVVCGLHGLFFGTLYAPVQAIVFGLNLKGTIDWIIAGLPFDAIHGVSNALLSVLILPLVKAIKTAQKSI